MKYLLQLSMILLTNQLVSQINNLPNNYSFLALGDSYTIGTSVSFIERWPIQLRDSINKRGVSNDTVIFTALNGWRTDQLIDAIASRNLSNDFDLVSLLIGVNNQFQNRDINNYRNEFRQLIHIAIELAGSSKDRVIVLSIPDYAFTPFGQSFSNPTLISEEIDSFNIINKFISDSLGILYIDVTGISRTGLSNTSMVASDGLHPSGQQYSLWVEKILNLTLNISNDFFSNHQQMLFPIPSKGIINIKGDPDNIIIRDTSGKILLESKSKTMMLTLHEGLYIAEIHFRNRNPQRQKFIISN